MSVGTCIHGIALFSECDRCEATKEVTGAVDAPVPQSAEIRRFNGVTLHNLDPELVLGAARNAQLKSVTVIGYDEDGDFYFASTEACSPSVLWDLQKAIYKLMEVGE